MIVYQKEPVSPVDASKLKAWLAAAEAHLFRQCVTAHMNELYFDAINLQTKEAESVQDEAKFNNQSEVKLRDANNILNFIRLFEFFADPDYGFHKLKTNT